MANERIVELEASLKAMGTRAETAEASLAAATTEIETLTATVATVTEERYNEGVTAGTERLKERLEAYSGNKDLVIETALDDDATFKDKVLEAMKTELAANRTNDETGAPGVDFSEGDNPSATTFEAEVEKKIEAGKTKTQALSECSSEFPALHKDYIKRTTAARRK